MKKIARIAVALGTLGIVSGAQAAPVYNDFTTGFIADTYWGGYSQAAPNADIVASDTSPSSPFAISGMVVNKTGNDLKVTLTTNYAGTVGQNNVGELGTIVGALFLGSSPVDDSGIPVYNTAAPNGGGVPVGPNYGYDLYTADPGRFDFALAPGLTDASPQGDTQAAVLYDLAPGGGDVQTSFYPNPANTSGSAFRAGQAVGVLAGTPAVGAGSWGIVNGTTIEFTVVGFFALSQFTSALQTSLTLAWAMSCANDVILTTIGLPGQSVSDVPLPAGLVLLLSGLFGMGLLGRFKSRVARSLA